MVTYDSTVTGGNGIAEPAEYELPEGRLALAGATLSRRLENGQGIWRLELPTPSGEPFVVEQAGGPVTPPKEVRKAIPAFLRGDGPRIVDPEAEPREELAAVDVDHALSLDPALGEVSPYDDDRLDPLATPGTSLERVAQARGSCAKPALR